MGLAQLFGLKAETDEDMARARKAKQPVNAALVAAYVERLRGAKTDRAKFDVILGELKGDVELRPIDIMAIANAYGVGGAPANSRKSGLEKIAKRFVELVRYDAKNRVAEKARPW
jgi:hypothetical protein